MKSVKSVQSQVSELKEEIEKIKFRNKRVEADKAWETSWTRTMFVALSTFVLAFGFMLLVEEREPFGKALIGTAAYIMSTSTYGFLKNWWLERSQRDSSPSVHSGSE